MSEDDLRSSICAALSGGPLSLAALTRRLYGDDIYRLLCQMGADGQLTSHRGLNGEVVFCLNAMPAEPADDGIPEFLKKH